jgi:hypothetical protein
VKSKNRQEPPAIRNENFWGKEHRKKAKGKSKKLELGKVGVKFLIENQKRIVTSPVGAAYR